MNAMFKPKPLLSSRRFGKTVQANTKLPDGSFGPLVREAHFEIHVESGRYFVILLVCGYVKGVENFRESETQEGDPYVSIGAAAEYVAHYIDNYERTALEESGLTDIDIFQ